MQQQLKAFNSSAHKKLALTYFNATHATAKAISITALLMYYKTITCNATFTQLLTVEDNIQQLEVALAKTRNANYFCPASYATAINKFRKNKQLVQQYALHLLQLVTE